jgi:hypothetical protein
MGSRRRIRVKPKARYSHSTDPRSRKPLASILRPALAASILIAATFAFWPSLKGVFIWDDQSCIVENSHIRNLSHLATVLQGGAPTQRSLVGPLPASRSRSTTRWPRSMPAK